jgi:SSS family solute:Na+ symporter
VTLSLGAGAVAAVGLYLALLVGIGYVTRRQGSRTGFSDFYLAGRGLSGFVLLLTLYATQYSGNTLLGYPGEAYRLGFSWVMSIGFMMAVIVVYQLFAPQLHVLAQRHAYVTPGDWIAHRFDAPRLTLLANVLLVLAISNYLLAQLVAMGHVTEGLSGGTVPYWVGVVLLTLVVIIYETAGGMRAVAWTDCVQGVMLAVGLVGLLVAVAPTPGHLAELTSAIAATQPEKVAVPSWEVSRNWFSTILLIGCSAAVYPHAIQRIYAARSLETLRRSFAIMVFLPLVTTGAVFMVGMFAIQELGTTGPIDADQVVPLLLNHWSTQSLTMYVLCIVVITAIVAAIMSTADSVLLSLSSILAKDVVGPVFMPEASDAELTRAGKRLSWVVVTILVGIALAPRITLWGLTEIKMELLAQVAPLFLLGVRWHGMTGRGALAGMVVGTSVYLALLAAGLSEVWNIHAGIVALGVNVAVCVVVSQSGHDPRLRPIATSNHRTFE